MKTKQKKGKNPKWFNKGINPFWQRLEREEVQALNVEYLEWQRLHAVNSNDRRVSLLLFLKETIKERLTTCRYLENSLAQFRHRHAKADTKQDRHRIILDYTIELNGKKRSRGDVRALRRWFDSEAVAERYQRRLMETSHFIGICLRQVTFLVALSLPKSLLSSLLAVSASCLQWKGGGNRLFVEAIRSMSIMLCLQPEDQFIEKLKAYAEDQHENTWVQCEAIKGLQSLVSEREYFSILMRCLQRDDLFIRRCCVKQIVHLKERALLTTLISVILKDTSAFVRQGLAACLKDIPLAHFSSLYESLCADEEPAVRAAAIGKAPFLLHHSHVVISVLEKVLQQESNPSVQRFAIESAVEVFSHQTVPEERQRSISLLVPLFQKLHTEATCTSVRRVAAQARERLWCQSYPPARKFFAFIQPKLITALKTGKKFIDFKSKELEGYDEITMGRVLSVLAQGHFPLELERTFWKNRLFIDHRFSFRWWRFFYEITHPSPEKRQSFSHFIGRKFTGTLRVPSGIMGELSPTKVPGEPLFVQSEGSWRPYLPLVEEFISAAETAKPIAIFTSEGMVTIRPPRNFFCRLWAEGKLSFFFSRYAKLRNWKEGDSFGPSYYLQKMRKLGFHISIEAYPPFEKSVSTVEPRVKRFFPLVLPLFVEDMWSRLTTYFYSLYQNTLTQLMIFVGVITGYFFGRHIYLSFLIRKARQSIPLVIGGWGTRGKSGVERMKAALFYSLGFRLIAKTTGCETLFLYAFPGRKIQELPLFRPYEKATIWEQGSLLRFSQKLKVSLFLWECMALTPRYARVLQRQWMKDDLTTLTNTYPDHEDLQGPAGRNIPEAMTHFIPEKASLITTEEQMLPILHAETERASTSLQSVTWKDAFLLTPEVLNRFPYKEHPRNVALVLALAERVGVDPDFALKEIADQVVPDIGVLKAYKTASLAFRQLQFVNGMSANERLACLENWKRMHFDEYDSEKNPEIWITTLVNNRDDRIARMRVFASILAEDLQVDRHYLVGTNLKGMRNFLIEAWQEKMKNFTLWPEGHSALAVFEREAHYYRVPQTAESVQNFLQVMLKAQCSEEEIRAVVVHWNEPQQVEAFLKQRKIEHAMDIIEHLKDRIKHYEEYSLFCARLKENPRKNKKTKQACKRLLKKWFCRKIVVIDDPYVTGEQLVAQFFLETPPGVLNRMMGLQNIKGPGLEFVHRWQAWEKCWHLCEPLLHEKVSMEAIRRLGAFENYNLLSKEVVFETVKKLQEKLGLFAHEERKEILEIVKKVEHLQAKAKLFKAKKRVSIPEKRGLNRLIGWMEELMDVADSVKRRKRADLIYKDLAAERISLERAAFELQKLETRQKGGWLRRLQKG